jgi:predicted esterase
VSAAGDPHAGQPVLHAGAALEGARAAVVMLHGRGATAEDILSLRGPLAASGVAFFAPQAAGRTWYPHSFLADLERNEPHLSSALRRVESLVADLERQSLPAERTVLLGFSQGACLACEFAARNARRWGGVVAFTGGLIGPPGTPRDYPGAFAATPVFLGAGDPDPHVPRERVEETAEVFRRLGADVDVRIYPGLGHAIAQEELEIARRIVAAALD